MEKQLILIMGPWRTGKSTLAKILGSELSAMWFSTDSLIWMLHRAAPQLDVPNDGFEPEEKARGIEPYLFAFLENTTYNHGLTIAEGDAILPRQLAKLDKQFGVAAAVCLVNTTPQPEKLIVGGGWASHLDSTELVRAARWLADYSNRLRSEAEAAGIPCFDVGDLTDNDRLVAPRESVLNQLRAMASSSGMESLPPPPLGGHPHGQSRVRGSRGTDRERVPPEIGGYAKDGK